MLGAIGRYLNRVRQRFKSYLEGRRNTVYEISHDENQMNVSWLTMENEKDSSSLAWNKVVSVKAFKRDLFAVDQICLEFELKDGGALEIHEGMQGWQSLVSKLPDYLPGCKRLEEWFQEVAFPAFELNLTTIFERGE